MAYNFHKPEKLPKFMTWKEIRIFFDSFNKNSYHNCFYYYLYKTMLYSGIRISEALSIKITDISFEECNILIRHTKNGTQHLAVLHPGFVPELKEWIKYLKGFFPNTPYLFPKFNKNPNVGRVNSSRYFKVQLNRCGLSEEYHPHSLRHSFATHLYEEGVPLEKIQILLNHTDITSTQIYVYCAVKSLIPEVCKLEMI
jgi:site-specific recombinase XerD